MRITEILSLVYSVRDLCLHIVLILSSLFGPIIFLFTEQFHDEIFVRQLVVIATVVVVVVAFSISRSLLLRWYMECFGKLQTTIM